MNEKMKKLAEELSKNPELVERMKSMSKDELIEAAKELNVELTEEDFQPSEKALETHEMSDVELSQVSGGGWCGCSTLLGSGTGTRMDNHNHGLDCFCIGGGYGDIHRPEEHKCTGAGTGMCVCPVMAGFGATDGMDENW